MSAGDDFRKAVEAEYDPADVDGHLLDQAARTLDELEQLQAAVDRDGVTVQGARGNLVAHPSLVSIKHHRLLFAALFKQLFGDSETPSQKAARAARARWGRV